MRPIVSSINGPNGKLARFLTDILTSAYNSENEYYIKDSFSFSSFINDYQLLPDYVIVSFDVVSLLTNVPLEVILDTLTRNFNTISQHCNLDLDSFLKVLKFIFDSNCLVFDGKFYKQIFGTPMGSSISPILVNFVLDDLVNNVRVKINFNIPFIKRYVDDLLLALPEDKIDHVLAIFNSFNPNIQFTAERENNHSIPFLDMLVIRNPNTNVLCTKWYTKPMSSGRYINYFSYHPPRMKKNLILALKNRVIRLSHPQHRNESLQKLKKLLIDNSYPIKFINSLLFNYNERSSFMLQQNNTNAVRIDSNAVSNNTLPSSTPSRNAQNNNNQEGVVVLYKTLPYVDNLTPRLINIFKNHNIKIALTNVITVSKLFSKLKTPVKLLDKSNVVYKIPCGECSKSYIGQTSRYLQGRINSHKSDINRNVNSCGLTQHAIDTGHTVSWSNAKILDVESNYFKRTFLEMVHINNTRNNLNKKSDIDGLSCIYSYILSMERGGFSGFPPRP
nr:unnamed protein product [Callosobruchus analis]